VAAMEALKDLAGQRELLLVGDAKLLSRGNILSMGQAQVTFIAPASKVYLPAGVLGGLDVQQASPLDYMASIWPAVTPASHPRSGAPIGLPRA
jgi:hypothetical protein